MNNVLEFPTNRTFQRNAPKGHTLICVKPSESKASDFITYEMTGDSMNRIGVLHGDTLITKTVFNLSEITPETVCIVRLSDGTKKTRLVRFDGESITLRCANPNYPPATYPKSGVQITGIVTDIQRSLRGVQ